MLLKIERLNIFYPNEVSPLINIQDFSIEAQSPIMLVAPSGWGKTTLFRALSGWFKGNNSAIKVVCSWNFDSLKDVEFVGNHPSLLPWKRVIENILLRAKDSNLDEALSALEAVGLKTAVADMWPYELSLGMYKRVEFVAAILSRRSVLILDEFFSYLFTIIPVSAVECRMTATGLLGIVVYCTVKAFQYLHHVPGCFRKKLINIAGNENVDNHLFVRLRQM